MIESVANFGSLNVTWGAMAHAAARPTVVAPAFRERRERRRGQHAASTVALAPAAMSALIEAQESRAPDGPSVETDPSGYRKDTSPYRSPLDLQA